MNVESEADEEAETNLTRINAISSVDFSYLYIYFMGGFSPLSLFPNFYCLILSFSLFLYSAFSMSNRINVSI